MALRHFAKEYTSPTSLLKLSREVYRTFSAAFSASPSGYKFAKSHEWVSIDGDVAKVGISEFAQKELGEVVYVELPEPGATVKKGETFGVVESVKAASDVYSPISGEVVESNNALSETPGTINTDPFESGWIMKVKMSNKSELNDLMNSKAYDESCNH